MIYGIMLLVLVAMLYFRYEQNKVNQYIYDKLDNYILLEIKEEDKL